MIYLLHCPHCRHNMKYSPMKAGENKRKTCVYCGKSFSVKNSIIKKEG